jgi:hypothetical protein
MLAPGAVQSSVELLQSRPECAFVYGHEQAIGPDGKPTPSYGLSPGKCLAGDLYVQLLAANDALRGPSAVMHRRQMFEALGGFTDGLHGCEDFDLHLRALREWSVACNDRVLLIKRNHGENLSTKWSKMLKGAVRAQRQQKPFVDNHPQYRAAYRTGMRLARRYNGRQLERQVAGKLIGRIPAELGTDLAVLTRYAPERLITLPATILRFAARRALGRPTGG